MTLTAERRRCSACAGRAYIYHHERLIRCCACGHEQPWSSPAKRGGDGDTLNPAAAAGPTQAASSRQEQQEQQ